MASAALCAWLAPPDEGLSQARDGVPQRQVIGVGTGLHDTVFDPGSDRLNVFRAGDRLQVGGRGGG